MTGAAGSGAPLAGVAVAVTRAPDDAPPLAAALRALGADVALTPLVRVQPLPPDAAGRAALADARAYEWVAVTSRHAVDELARALAALGVALPATPPPRVAAVGGATADAARGRGWRVDLVPERHDAASLARTMAAAGTLRGARVLFPRAERARETLPDALRAAGAAVDEVTLYRTAPDPAGAAALRARLLGPGAPIVTLASGSAARALAHGAGPAAARARLVTIGPSTTAAARALGLPVAAEAREASVDGLVEAVARVARAGADGAGGTPAGAGRAPAPTYEEET